MAPQSMQPAAKRWAKALGNLHRLPELYNALRHAQAPQQLIRGYLRVGMTSHPWVFRSRDGATIQVDDWWDATTIWGIFCRREYVVRKNDKSVIDLGANIGAFTIYALERAPSSTVHCYEPYPPTHDRLVANLDRNGFRDRVSTFSEGVGPERGQMWMRTAEATSVTRQTEAVRPGNDAVDVPIITLDDAVDRMAADVVDLLKVDIEGGETELLLNAQSSTLTRIRRICVEVHRPIDIPPISGRLREAGFDVIDAAHHGAEQTLTFEQATAK